MQDVVDTEAHDQVLLLRLDVDVARALLHRLLQERVHQPDDRRALVARVEQVLGLGDQLRGDVREIRGVELVGHVLGGRRLVVDVVDAVQDRAARDQHRLAARAREDHAQVVERIGEQGVGDRDLHAIPVALDRQHEVVLRERDRELRGELGVDLLGRQRLARRDAVHAGERADQLALGHELELEQDVGEPAARLLLLLQRLLQAFLGEGGVLEQDAAQLERGVHGYGSTTTSDWTPSDAFRSRATACALASFAYGPSCTQCVVEPCSLCESTVPS